MISAAKSIRGRQQVTKGSLAGLPLLHLGHSSSNLFRHCAGRRGECYNLRRSEYDNFISFTINNTNETSPLESILAARERVYQAAVRTPLVRLYYDDAPGEIYLKLESFQPIGSFKLRGAHNAISLLSPQTRRGACGRSAPAMPRREWRCRRKFWEFVATFW